MTMKKSFMAQTIDPQNIADLIRTCSDEIVMPLFRQGITDKDVFEKTSKIDIATTADHEVEKKLTDLLPRLYSGSRVIGEEATHDNPALLDMLHDKQGVIWVIDPVDGTANFAKGNPHFAVMMACVVDGVTEYGWIYDALNDDMVIAQKGQGAFSNGEKLQTPEIVKPLSDINGYTSLRHLPYKPVDARQIIKDAGENIGAVSSLGCAAHEYLGVTRGVSDFTIYGKMKAWDHLAGALILRESGGVVRKWDGSEYAPTDQRGGILAAINEQTWQQIADNFKLNDIVNQFKVREKKL